MKNFICLLSFILINLNTLHSANYYVSTSGNNNNDGTSPLRSFRSIQRACPILMAGDTLFVLGGHYQGFNHLDYNSGTSQKPIVYMALGDEVIIDTGFYRSNGINIEGNDYIHIIGFRVKGMQREGIRAVHADYIKIHNNYCEGCYRGIFTGYTDHIIITNNVCIRSHGEHGIYVSNNSDQITLLHNLCAYNNASGIQINPDLSSGEPGISYGVICAYNLIHENKRAAGLNFQGINDALIYNNLIYNNHEASGITLFKGDASQGCRNVMVYHNTILVPSDGRWGIHIVEDAENIKLINNIVLNNHLWKGSIALDPRSESQTKIVSNYNLLTNRFCPISDGCSESKENWSKLGYDINSILEPSDRNLIFKNPTLNIYELTGGSPAIDRGSDESKNFITDDYFGVSRPQGMFPDIGAFEFQVSGNVLNESIRKNYYWSYTSESLNFSEQSGKMQIYDLNGRQVSNKLNLQKSEFVSGYYFYIYKSTQGDEMVDSGILWID